MGYIQRVASAGVRLPEWFEDYDFGSSPGTYLDMEDGLLLYYINASTWKVFARTDPATWADLGNPNTGGLTHGAAGAAQGPVVLRAFGYYYALIFDNSGGAGKYYLAGYDGASWSLLTELTKAGTSGGAKFARFGNRVFIIKGVACWELTAATTVVPRDNIVGALPFGRISTCTMGDSVLYDDGTSAGYFTLSGDAITYTAVNGSNIAVSYVIALWDGKFWHGKGSVEDKLYYKAAVGDAWTAIDTTGYRILDACNLNNVLFLGATSEAPGLYSRVLSYDGSELTDMLCPSGGTNKVYRMRVWNGSLYVHPADNLKMYRYGPRGA